MPTHDVLIPPSVETEIEDIADYIAKDNPRAAHATLMRLYERCLTLQDFPERGRRYGRYRFLVEGPYLIVYRIEPEPSARVIIVTIFHSALDIARMLEAPDD